MKEAMVSLFWEYSVITSYSIHYTKLYEPWPGNGFGDVAAVYADARGEQFPLFPGIDGHGRQCLRYLYLYRETPGGTDPLMVVDGAGYHPLPDARIYRDPSIV